MTTLRATAAAYGVQRPEARRTETCMTNLMMQLSETVCDERGTFHPRAMARQRSNGSWEGWLEFVPTGEDRSRIYVTPMETHQHDRMTMEYWASGLTAVYAEGALARAQMKQTAIRGSDLLVALQELVEALDKRRPHLERAGEAQILVDARRLRVSAIKRIAFLREHDADRISSLHPPKGTPMKNNTNEQRNAISGWEGEGGAGLSDQSGKGIVQGEKRAAEQDRRDASHQSDVRGEHRYPDAEQTAAEQTARRNRDNLKRRLARRLAPGSERKLRRK
jgi:hypothetical protein